MTISFKQQNTKQKVLNASRGIKALLLAVEKVLGIKC
jgi:hypothetical protein